MDTYKAGIYFFPFPVSTIINSFEQATMNPATNATTAENPSQAPFGIQTAPIGENQRGSVLVAPDS